MLVDLLANVSNPEILFIPEDTIIANCLQKWLIWSAPKSFSLSTR